MEVLQHQHPALSSVEHQLPNPVVKQGMGRVRELELGVVAVGKQTHMLPLLRCTTLLNIPILLLDISGFQNG